MVFMDLFFQRDFAGPSSNNSSAKEGPINHETNHRRNRFDRPR